MKSIIINSQEISIQMIQIELNALKQRIGRGGGSTAEVWAWNNALIAIGLHSNGLNLVGRWNAMNPKQQIKFDENGVLS